MILAGRSFPMISINGTVSNDENKSVTRKNLNPDSNIEPCVLLRS